MNEQKIREIVKADPRSISLPHPASDRYPNTLVKIQGS